jgi:hypothetical protein
MSHGKRREEPTPRRAVTAADIVDRVIDRGIVIDHRSNILIGGIDTGTAVDGHYVVSSFDTHLKYTKPSSEPIPNRRHGDKPRFDGPADAFSWGPRELGASARLMRRKKRASVKR